MNRNVTKLVRAAKAIEDPRRQTGCFRHRLVDIIVIAFCAILCGAQSYDDLEVFGKARYTWLSVFLELPNGIPSADTFERVFELLDPQKVVKRLRRIFSCDEIVGKIIAFDGKTIRGSKRNGYRAYHVLSAFLTDDQIVIGEEIVDEKSNEITAIPELLGEINVKGATVTIDAMGAQKEIAEKIIEEGADYVLALKRNKSSLHDSVRGYFALYSPPRKASTRETGHGREETREYFLDTDIDWLTNQPHELPQTLDWKGLAGIGAVRSTVIEKGKTRVETRYFITSLTDPERFSRAVRAHWGIENHLHWHLDFTFDEDKSRFRKGNSAAVWNVLRKIALECLKRVCPGKPVSLKTRRRLAGWDYNYHEQLLAAVLDDF